VGNKPDSTGPGVKGTPGKPGGAFVVGGKKGGGAFEVG